MSSPFLWATRNAIAMEMTYRVNFATAYILRTIQLLIALVVWRAIFDGQQTINGYTWNGIASYLILISTLSMVYSPTHMFRLHLLVRKGTLSSFLLRPFSYERLSWAEFFGKKLPIIVGASIYGLIACLVISVHPTLHITPFAIALTLLSLLISFYVGLSIATLTFWLIEMWPLKRLFQGSMLLLGGLAAPLQLYPPMLRAIASYTPFPYLGYVPVAALTGRLPPSQATWYLAGALIWSLVLFLLYQVLWKLGLKRYEAVNS